MFMQYSGDDDERPIKPAKTIAPIDIDEIPIKPAKILIDDIPLL